MHRLYQRLQEELDTRLAEDRYRSLWTYTGHDFGSNDYLGFATDPTLQRLSVDRATSLALSSAGSRLLPGHHAEHLAAERQFARFVGVESALLFNSGYDANVAILTTLPSRHDVILYDERAHASIVDGARASQAQAYKFAHNSVEDLTLRLGRIVAQRPTATVFIVAESVYSMDGDEAPLADLARIAREANALLVIDEAHATGVLGPRGEGAVTGAIGRTANIITIHTCGKALGAAGAFVAASELVTNYLVNAARQFIFTTALPPFVPLQIMNSLSRLENRGTDLTEQLLSRAKYVRSSLQAQLIRWSVPAGRTPIIPIIVGEASAALKASTMLEAKGFDVPAVRPPSVPAGSSRLRLNVSLRHPTALLDEVIAAILETEAQMEA